MKALVFIIFFGLGWACGANYDNPKYKLFAEQQLERAIKRTETAIENATNGK